MLPFGFTWFHMSINVLSCDVMWCHVFRIFFCIFIFFFGFVCALVVCAQFYIGLLYPADSCCILLYLVVLIWGGWSWAKAEWPCFDLHGCRVHIGQFHFGAKRLPSHHELHVIFARDLCRHNWQTIGGWKWKSVFFGTQALTIFDVFYCILTSFRIVKIC